VRVENFQGARAATRHLLEHGYADIAFVAGPSASVEGRARFNGYRRALADAGIDPPSRPQLRGDFTEQGGERAVAQLLRERSRPHIVRWHDFSFVTNPAGTRIAGGGWPSCLSCSGPVTILDGRSGAVVGTAGGSKLDNVDPSVSPDGTKVAYEHDSSNGSGKTFGSWTARTNGKSIAFEAGEGSIGKLAVVDVATGKVRRLLQLYYAPTAVWSSDSSELLANTVPKSQKCWSTWRVPVDGSKPTLISSCS
jgi:hypothetical protein